MTHDEVMALTGDTLVAAYDEIVLGHPHWGPYVWSVDIPHEPCGGPLDQCRYNHAEHTLWAREYDNQGHHNAKAPRACIITKLEAVHA